MACNCVTGTAWTDSTGNCRCNNGGQCPDGYQETSSGECVPSRLPPIENPIDYSILQPKEKRKIINVDLPTPVVYTLNNIAKPAKTCNGLVAPNGYGYIRNANGECALVVDYDNNLTRYESTGGNPLTDAISAITDGGAGIGDSVSSFVANNKTLLVLGGIAVVGYFMFAGKGSGTSRTVISKRF